MPETEHVEELGLLDIGEVAARSGMATSALRFYEREQIIASVDRKGLRRQFRPEVLTTLGVVAMCRRAGFTLEEIKQLLATGGAPTWKAFVIRKRDELRAQAEHLDRIAGQLDHALGCPSANVFDCEHFRTALEEALPVAPVTPAPVAPAPVAPVAPTGRVPGTGAVRAGPT